MPVQSADPASLIRSAIDAGDWKLADKYVAAVLIAHPDDADLLTDVAKVSAFNNRQRDAAHFLVEAAELTNFSPESRVDDY